MQRNDTSGAPYIAHYAMCGIGFPIEASGLRESNLSEGHGFSRADDASQWAGALAPEVGFLPARGKKRTSAAKAVRIGALVGTAEAVPFRKISVLALAVEGVSHAA